MPSQSVNGTTIHYAEAGHGPAVVLVHEYPLNASMWKRQVESLSDQFRVIAPDLRGFGKSASGEPFTMESLADDLHAMFHKIGVGPIALAGFSLGGYVALAYARKYPADLRALILIDTRAEADTAEGKSNREKQIDLVKRDGATALADQMLPKLLSERTAKNSPQIVQAVRKQMESTSSGTIEHALIALRNRHDRTEHLASITAPTLILVGEEDVITPPAVSKKMHELIPRSKMVVIAASGHMSPMENPDDVTRHIREFLNSLPKS